MKARYRCLACDHQWRGQPGPVDKSYDRPCGPKK